MDQSDRTGPDRTGSASAPADKRTDREMDKESSVNCTRVTLIVTNLLCLLLGVTGFILGFARPGALYSVSVSGLQVSVFSLCLISAASLGLFAAITLNYHLLLSYSALIVR